MKGRKVGPGLLTCDKTVIAAVQGTPYGLGFNPALSCDMIIAADDALFARNQTRIGFGGFDMLLPVVLLKLGINRGYELLSRAGRSRPRTSRTGGVLSVVPREDQAQETFRYARAVALHSTDGLMIGRQAKKIFWDMMGHPLWNDFVASGTRCSPIWCGGRTRPTS